MKTTTDPYSAARSDPSAKRIVVVGGGISGLAAAWSAHTSWDGNNEKLEILVLEREATVGGKAQSRAEDGWLVECGPTGVLEGEAAVDRLIEAAGMESERVYADQAAARRFLVRGGRMREVHLHPLKFMRSGVLGLAGILRILREPFIPAKKDGEDESVWEFARRRIGRQAADRMISPMVLGVFAGDARKLSLPASFPRMAALESEYGSLIKAMKAKKKQGSSGDPGGPGGKLFSFHRGLQSLPETLAERGPFEVRCGAAVETVIPLEGNRWRIAVEDARVAIQADAVILAGEPWAMAAILESELPKPAEILNGIYCPPVMVLALGYDFEAAAGVPRGFGVLVPRGEGYRILGCLWDSYLFPGRSPEGSVLVRAMVGGAVDPEAAGLSDEEIEEFVRRDLERMLGIRGKPVFKHLTRWPRAIPQYELGHGEKVARLERELEAHPTLFVAGNSLRGIAFGSAAAAGWTCGEEAVAALLGGSSRPNGRGAIRAKATDSS